MLHLHGVNAYKRGGINVINTMHAELIDQCLPATYACMSLCGACTALAAGQDSVAVYNTLLMLLLYPYYSVFHIIK